MRTLIVFESMYGNTHAIANALAKGLAESGVVTVVPVADATAERLAAADMLVVGGPTHVHSLTSSKSRQGAVDAVTKPDSGLTLDPDAPVDGPGLRDWFATLPAGEGRPAIAFDTRFDGPELLTGHASHGIGSRLKKHGYVLATGPESFLVDKANRLVAGEAERAVAWVAEVAARTSVG